MCVQKCCQTLLTWGKCDVEDQATAVASAFRWLAQQAGPGWAPAVQAMIPDAHTHGIFDITVRKLVLAIKYAALQLSSTLENRLMRS